MSKHDKITRLQSGFPTHNTPSPLLQPPTNTNHGSAPRPSALKSQQSSGASIPLSVEEWEANAPLTDLQIRSVNTIKAASENAPFPLKFVADRESDDDEPESEPAIFEDIAQEAALLCRQSLLSTRDMSKARPPPSTPLDGDPFLVRHLLILKDVGKNLEGESISQGLYSQKDGHIGAFPNSPMKSGMMRTPSASGFGLTSDVVPAGGVTVLVRNLDDNVQQDHGDPTGRLVRISGV
ncbi:hypothetical protein FA15DRAFT_710054 [Coprinopsis marcescibilis]|uniref:Conserved oligomeric Golgi complex subunit 3 C-terminal domain-containing protein n=1 Tax=Coprinopsis marcescibilis TaxID=230819 RepID=A0A5C3KES5_COPMA|nr:hypothetical protein FA15DRAFT_710054 [Coprinopsis marcescibilis]